VCRVSSSSSREAGGEAAAEEAAEGTVHIAAIEMVMEEVEEVMVLIWVWAI